MPYYNGAVSATCENAQFIGPRVQPIVGGKATFYLRVEKPGIVSLKLDGGLLGLEQVSVKITEKMEKLPDAPAEGQTELECKKNSSVKEIYDLTLA